MLLKIIALLSMLIDHIGILYYPDSYIMRLIGRLAFPIFAWYLVLGLERTSDQKRYTLNILGLAIISQPFYMYSGIDEQYALNILFLLAAAAILIQSFKFKNYYVMLLSATLSIIFGYFSEYGILGLTAVLSLYIMRQSEKYTFLFHDISIEGIIVAAAALFLITEWIFWPAIFIFFMLVSADIDKTIPYRRAIKWVFYAFYPLHLAALTTFKYFII